MTAARSLFEAEPPSPYVPPAIEICRPHQVLARALRLRAAGAHNDAILEYEALLEAEPTHPEILLGLAAVLMTIGRDVPRAQLLLLRCCGIEPGRAEVWDALGVSLIMTHDPSAAEAAFAKANSLAPDMVDYALHRAEAALAAGTGEAELARLSDVEQDPLDVASLTARGLLLQHFGDRASAADVLEVAVTLRPDERSPTLLLGRVLATLNRAAQAEAVLARAIALDPDNPQPRNDRAAMLLRLQRPVEACAILQSMVEADASQPTVLSNLANAHAALGDQEKAVSTARAAIALAPDAHLPWRTLCNALPYHPNVGGATLLEALRSCSDRLPRTAAPVWPNTPDPHRRIRIGLLSGSLKVHPVGWLTVAGFEMLDPTQFELTCFAQNPTGDSIARRFHSIAHVWSDVGALDDAALVEQVRARGIDVLVDLGGYGESGRMAACALRLAPVQAKWVGMQNHSTGIPEMDWLITDRWETPIGFERYYSERLLRMPDGYVCYSPPVYAPDVAPLPMAANGYVTFGCFNNLAKMTPAVIETWARVLRATSTSRLVLKSHAIGNPAVGEGLRQSFESLGISPDRLELQGASPHGRFLAEYGRIDLVLDPFPYSGGLTTCEALWMGVPVVTLPGETFASRHSTSHLCNVGLQDWVATDLDTYVELAVNKARDTASLSRLRADLRRQVRTSPLCDAPRFGRNLGIAVRRMWGLWCEEQGRRTASA